MTTGELDTTMRALQPELIKDFESTTGIKVSRGADDATHSIWVKVERKGLDRRQGWSASTQFEAGRLVEQIHSEPRVGGLDVYGFKDAAGDRLAERLGARVRVDAIRQDERVWPD